MQTCCVLNALPCALMAMCSRSMEYLEAFMHAHISLSCVGAQQLLGKVEGANMVVAPTRSPPEGTACGMQLVKSACKLSTTCAVRGMWWSACVHAGCACRSTHGVVYVCCIVRACYISFGGLQPRL